MFPKVQLVPSTLEFLKFKSWRERISVDPPAVKKHIESFILNHDEVHDHSPVDLQHQHSYGVTGIESQNVAPVSVGSVDLATGCHKPQPVKEPKVLLRRGKNRQKEQTKAKEEAKTGKEKKKCRRKDGRRKKGW